MLTRAALGVVPSESKRRPLVASRTRPLTLSSNQTFERPLPRPPPFLSLSLSLSRLSLCLSVSSPSRNSHKNNKNIWQAAE